MRFACLFAAGLAIALASPGAALAYHNADFATPVNEGGGNGMSFTGSPRGKNLDCSACHAQAANAIGIEVTSTPAELFAEQRWTPGTSYELIVRMTGEHLGDPTELSGYDNNGFVAELNSDSGELVGGWAADDPERIFTLDAAGGDPRVVVGYAPDGGTEWRLTLLAPFAGAGRLTLYLGAVDGNAAGGGVETPVDPFGDDVFVGAWRFCESGTTCDTALPTLSEQEVEEAHESPTKGCNASGAGGGAIFVLLFLWVICRRNDRLILLGLLGISASACLDKGESLEPDECPNGLCGYTSLGNPLGTNPDLDRRAFFCDVQPVLLARCANLACHGDADRAFIIYGTNRLRLNPVLNEETPTPTTELEVAANLAAAQEFSNDVSPDESLLLIKPLDASSGGYYHFGKSLYYQSDVFETTTDIGYENIRNWINGATASADCEPTTRTGP